MIDLVELVDLKGEYLHSHFFFFCMIVREKFHGMIVLRYACISSFSLFIVVLQYIQSLLLRRINSESNDSLAVLELSLLLALFVPTNNVVAEKK